MSDTERAPCAGCAAGHPRNEQGEHVYHSTLMPNQVLTTACTAPEEERASGTFTVGVGGFSATDTQMMLNASVAALREVLPETVAVALFLVDGETGRMAFRRDGDKDMLYTGLAAWAQATLGRQG